MKVLVVIPTYGRIPYLNRALASFLAQDYDDKHLLIINDDKNVTLECNLDNVTCMNINRRILLPQKRNIGSTFGYYDIIMPYDDDDIMLPWRISKHVEQYIADPCINYYRNGVAYAISNGEFSIGVCSPNAGSYKRSAWHMVEGYANLINIGDDIEFWQKMPNKHEVRSDEEIDYVYNWSGVRFHTTHEPPHIEKIAYDQLVELDLLNKKYTITPDWPEYLKFITLRDIFNSTKEPVKVKHIAEGKIEIIK